MRAVDLSNPLSMHTPPWMGYASPKIYYTQRFSRTAVVSQWIEAPLHLGTHMDSEMHIIPNGNDIASMPLTRLYGEGVIVDVSDEVGEFDIIRPEHITNKVDVKKGDIVLIHTGFHHFSEGERDQNEETYYCRHPGGYIELAKWFVEMELRWTAVDCGSGDHPMNTQITGLRPDIAEEFERKKGVKLEEVFPKSREYVMHKLPFPHGITHVENLGGDIDEVLNTRCMIGCFPFKFVGGEAAFARVVAFVED